MLETWRIRPVAHQLRAEAPDRNGGDTLSLLRAVHLTLEKLMIEITSTITSRGQATIPKQVRETLGVGAADKITFVVHDSGRVEVRPVRYTLKDLDGIVPAIPGRESQDFNDFFEEAMEERIDQLAGLTPE
jgi:AbrB family looped-hinge helix DNA binding protein